MKSLRYLVPALDDLGTLLKGRPVAPVELFEAARKSLHFVGYEGLSMIAASGLDMAAWDALAQAAGQPLCALLGGSVGPVKAYNSNGLWLQRAGGRRRGGAGTARRGRLHRAEAAAGTRERRRRPCDPRRRAPRRRQRHEPDDRLQPGLTFRRGAAALPPIDDHGLAWIEEPIVYDNIDGYAQLARELRTPLQIGENFYGPREMHKALQRKACDLVMPDFMRIGGVTGWMRAAAIAGAAGVPMSTHLYPEVAAHVMRVTETAHWLEWQDWADPILEEPFKVEGGNLVIPDRPGVGLRWNEAAVKRYRYDA